MYMKQDLSDEIIANSDLDTFRQEEAKNMELNCEHDTHRDGLLAFQGRDIE